MHSVALVSGLCLGVPSVLQLAVLKQYYFRTVLCEVLYKCCGERCPSFKEPL